MTGNISVEWQHYRYVKIFVKYADILSSFKLFKQLYHKPQCLNVKCEISSSKVKIVELQILTCHLLHWGLEAMFSKFICILCNAKQETVDCLKKNFEILTKERVRDKSTLNV